MGVYENMFTELEREVPGSVIREADGSITLIGWHLEELDDSEDDQRKPDHIEYVAHRVGFAGVALNLPLRPIKRVKHQLLSVRVIDPFTKTPEEDAGRNTRGCCCGVGGKQPGSVKEKNKCSNDDYHLVPVIKSKFSQRVLHFFTRLFSR